MTMNAIDVQQHRQEVRRLHRRQRHQLRRRGRARSSACSAERRRQVHADPHADDAAAADLGHRASSTASTSSSSRTTCGESIGVIPQAMTSDLELSVEENLLIFAKLYGVPRDKRKRLIDELLEAVELTAVARQAGQEPVGRHAAARRDRARPGARAAHLLPRRADDRPRSVSRVAVWEMLQTHQAASATSRS